jgi:hypothetical protein
MKMEVPAPSRSASLLDLPNEILHQISKIIHDDSSTPFDTRTRTNACLARACRRLNGIASPFVYASIELTGRDFLNPDSPLFRTLDSPSGPSLREMCTQIRLNTSDGWPATRVYDGSNMPPRVLVELPDEGVRRRFQRFAGWDFPATSYLPMSTGPHWTIPRFTALLCHMPQLRRLRLEDSAKPIGLLPPLFFVPGAFADVLCHAVQALSQLRELEIAPQVWDGDFGAGMVCLTEISVSRPQSSVVPRDTPLLSRCSFVESSANVVLPGQSRHCTNDRA